MERCTLFSTMKEPIVYIIASAVVASVVAGIAARDVIWKKGSSKWISFTRAGYAFVILSAALVILPTILYVAQSRSDKAERDLRDSILRRSYDSSVTQIRKDFGDSNYRTLTVIGQTLAKYGYRLDTTEKRLTQMIHDSANMKTVLPDEPVLQMMTDQIGPGFTFLKLENTINHYRISFSSADGASCCFAIKMSTVVEDTVSKAYVYKGPVRFPLTDNDALNKNASQPFTFMIDDNNPYDYLFLWVRGTYKDRNGKNTYTIDRVYYNRKLPNSFGSMQGDTRNRVITATQLFEK